MTGNIEKQTIMLILSEFLCRGLRCGGERKCEADRIPPAKQHHIYPCGGNGRTSGRMAGRIL